jgi:hypothetical protein
MYVELKSGFGDSGPASIGWVEFSKSGHSIYYRSRRLERLRGGSVSGNYYDVDTGDEYWVSGVKKNRQDRHWAGSGPVEVDPDAVEEYRRRIGS